uniref:Putative tetralaris n=1 Tax=Rhipicephalus pulchellus TaxID=72859 RepID=L7LR68_RHIPC
MFHSAHGLVFFAVFVHAYIKRPNFCDQPRDPGPCKARILSWFFDEQTSSCKKFYYGGCGGNRNRFDSKDVCKVTCHPHKGRPSFCDKRPETGPCRARIPAIYFDALTSTCKSFTYGGCGGNKNRFTTEETCLKTCRPPISPCKLPRDPGPCQYRVSSWYFERSTKICKHFVYGGCGGNENRFTSEKLCQTKCLPAKHQELVCSRELHTRSCIKGTQWYFNSSLGLCEKLPLRKCATSANKFETCIQCIERCTGLAPQKTCQEIIKRLPGRGNPE